MKRTLLLTTVLAALVALLVVDVAPAADKTAVKKPAAGAKSAAPAATSAAGSAATSAEKPAGEAPPADPPPAAESAAKPAEAAGCSPVTAGRPVSSPDDITDEDVQKGIDAGVEFLFSRQKDNGWFSENAVEDKGTEKPMKGAYESMAMLGLAFAPVSLKDERMKKGFDALLKLDLDLVYTVSPRVQVICRLMKQLGREDRELALEVLKKDLKFLQDAQNELGAWGYDLEAHAFTTYGWDFSNTQMAILALSEADMAHVELKPDCFLKSQKLFMDRQRADGGWNYGMRGGFQDQAHPDGAVVGSYGSMTAAAVATLFITRDFLYRGIGCPCKNEKSGRTPKVIDEAIDRGLGWLAEKFTVTVNPLGSKHHWKIYWLYSCERVGLAAGLKYFGTHDWYREGAREILGTVKRGGGWGYVPDTSWAICFLAKGRAPILFNKLKFAGDWNNHPRDVANLANYVGKVKEQLINWQIINLDVPVREWHDAPILYVTAEEPLKLSAEQKRKLRLFTDTGGTIFFEASCGNRAAATALRALAQEVWPEWELHKLDKDHPVYSSDQKIAKVQGLFGLDDGLRTPVFFAPVDMSCYWNTEAVTTHKDLFDLGANLYMYATDHRALRTKLAGVAKTERKNYASAVISAGPRKDLTMARVKHSGDWYVGKNYDLPGVLGDILSNRAPADARMAQLRQEADLPADPAATGGGGGANLKSCGEVAMNELTAANVQIAYFTGRKAIGLGPEDQKLLKSYLAAGGFMLAEAALGDRRVEATFTQMIEELGLKMRKLGDQDPLITGALAGASGHRLDAMRYRYALRTERVGVSTPELYGVYLAAADGKSEKLVGVFSPCDLLYSMGGYDAWNNRGYETEDALAILTNIVMLVSAR